MYRRKLESLPPDFTFPDTLEGLGYFINEDDQIRMIDDPELPFHYHASKNERFVETQKAAMTRCMSDIITKRLQESGVTVGRLPLGATEVEPHVPILLSNNLKEASRVVVYFGEIRELGMMSGRLMNTEGLDIGSVVNLVRGALADGLSEERSSSAEGTSGKAESDVGVIITNPGQLVWHRRGKRAVSFDGWYAIPRPSAAHDARPITNANKIPRNETSMDHFQCVFDDVISQLIETGIKVDIICVNRAIEDVASILGRDWAKWKAGISAIVNVCSNVYPLDLHDEDFLDFWGKRARVYIQETEPFGTPMTGRQIVGCNVYSSGVSDFSESIVPLAYKGLLDYFKLVHKVEDYVNVPQDIPEPNIPSDEDGSGWQQEEDSHPKQEGDAQAIQEIAQQNDGKVDGLDA